ncbi:hypothetical protein M413DRAFT_236022 [Hebeloma cylindrosporum]|uniref:Protein kinase domain-containing protein n=1 Tax=Hebeloma cylindrosporum TaxID=76867 RepID=A0A0C3C4E1_HEBCY|nr:hypothetical protein M413DRAFT_236022 [Hebeloma cylindrosporum h7]
MLSTGDPFEKHLSQTLHSNITTTFGRKPQNPRRCKPFYPVSFYDRHLASQLVLKHITINPSIPHFLSQLCEKEIVDFVTAGHSFTTNEFITFGFRKLNSVMPSQLGLHYATCVSRCCSSIASRIFFHPSYPSCVSAFIFWAQSVEGPGTNFLAEGTLDVDNRLTGSPEKAKSVPLFETMDESTTSKLKDLAMHSAHLATWELYAMTPSAHKLLKSMQTSDFKWDRSHVRGVPADFCSLQVPADAKSEFIGKLHRDHAQKKRKVVKQRTSSNTPRVKLAPAIPQHANTKGRPYRPDPSHYLQRAWARAVENDATFIIFHCGDRERIGIRHRESQTLYLSELIDTTACKDPPYGAIQVGLHLAIMQDALQRQKQRSSHDPSSLTKKRPAEHGHASVPESKRQKVTDIRHDHRKESGLSDIEQIQAVLSSKALALLSLNYGTYHSPTPSSFIRVGASCVRGYHDQPFKEPSRKATYNSSQYFSLILSEEIGSGAIGVVHRATAELQLESGLKVHHRLAVKLVFSNHLGYQRKLRKEHSIYHYLASKDNIEGVLPVYGLFEDTETGTLALIMDDGGSSIRYGVSVPEKQRISFTRAMASIHRAGVRHFDLRPNNLLINEEGETFIIDFDRAQLNPRPQAISREVACLKHVLDGKEDDEDFYSAPPNSYHSESDTSFGSFT